MPYPSPADEEIGWGTVALFAIVPLFLIFSVASLLMFFAGGGDGGDGKPYVYEEGIVDLPGSADMGEHEWWSKIVHDPYGNAYVLVGLGDDIEIEAVPNEQAF